MVDRVWSCPVIGSGCGDPTHTACTFTHTHHYRTATKIHIICGQTCIIYMHTWSDYIKPIQIYCNSIQFTLRSVYIVWCVGFACARLLRVSNADCGNEDVFDARLYIYTKIPQKCSMYAICDVVATVIWTNWTCFVNQSNAKIEGTYRHTKVSQLEVNLKT